MLVERQGFSLLLFFSLSNIIIIIFFYFALPHQEFYDKTGPNHVSQAREDELYRKWGGIPRYVLEKANNTEDQDDLVVAINKCTTSDIMTYTGAEETPAHIAHKLLHMIVQRDAPGTGKSINRFSKYQTGVASEYVARALTGECWVGFVYSFPFLFFFYL